LRWALFGFLAVLALILLLWIPPGAPLRPTAADTTSPLLASLLFIIFLFFLISGICYGFGAGTFKTKDDVIQAGTKTLAGLGGLILMFLLISQFIAFFYYTNNPRVTAIPLARAPEKRHTPALPILIRR